MRFKSITVAATILALGASRPAAAQAMVSFDVPLSMTQINADIERVRVVCAVMSEALVLPPIAGGWGGFQLTSENIPPNAGRQDLWVMAGQVVVTVRVIVSIPAEWLQNPVGKKAIYTCMVMGFSKTRQVWNFFSEQSTDLAFKLKVTPEAIQGEFVW